MPAAAGQPSLVPSGSGRQCRLASRVRMPRKPARTQQHEGAHVQIHQRVDEVAIRGAHSAADDICGREAGPVRGRGMRCRGRGTGAWKAPAHVGCWLPGAPQRMRWFVLLPCCSPIPRPPEAPLMNLVSECTTTSAPSLRRTRWKQRPARVSPQAPLSRGSTAPCSVARRNVLAAHAAMQDQRLAGRGTTCRAAGPSGSRQSGAHRQALLRRQASGCAGPVAAAHRSGVRIIGVNVLSTTSFRPCTKG